MPQSKAMKIQWLNIDGRQVPLVLPQVWDDNKQDWVVTGHAAPLPMTDSAVKSELEQIKQENTEIKQTQQEILARLDAGLDTRLTGSIIENGVPMFNVGNSFGATLAENLVVPSGSSKTVSTVGLNLGIDGSRKATIYVSASQKFRASVYFYDYVNNNLVSSSIPIATESTGVLTRPSFLTVDMPVTKRMAVIVVNESDIDMTTIVNVGFSK